MANFDLEEIFLENHRDILQLDDEAEAAAFPCEDDESNREVKDEQEVKDVPSQKVILKQEDEPKQKLQATKIVCRNSNPKRPYRYPSTYEVHGVPEFPNSPPIFAKKLKPQAIIPRKASKFSAGFDVFSCDDTEIQPGKSRLIHTGIAMQIPFGFYGKIASRSGLALRKKLFSFHGTVDADFTGEICVLLFNKDSNCQQIKQGDRIAQLIITKISDRFFIKETNELKRTQRGDRGFGTFSGIC